MRKKNTIYGFVSKPIVTIGEKWLIHSKVYEQSYFNLHSDSVELSIKSRPGWRVRVLLNLVEYCNRAREQSFSLQRKMVT